MIAEKKAREVYVKHHSFDSFFSNIAADVGGQKKRVVLALSQDLSDLPTAQQKILHRALSDLQGDGAGGHIFQLTPYIADELARIADSDIARYIYHRYRYDIFPQEKIVDAYPPYLQIEPTSLCNYRCVFCYQSDKTFSAKSSGMMGSMSLALFKLIVDQICGRVEFISLASRGEPTIHAQLGQMLTWSVGRFLGLKLNTNASLLNEKLCHAILAGGVSTVVFSADAAAEPLYSQMRVGGSLDRVLGKIELFQKIRCRDYPHAKIISRVSGVHYSPQQDMDDMKKTWSGLVDQIAFVAYNPWENVYEAPANDVTQPCSDLWRRMFIWYDGKVNPCDTDYKSILTVGNLEKSSISEVWCSQAYQALRESHRQKKRSELFPCHHCVVV